MIVQQAAQCSITYMLAQSFFGGYLSSAAFILNMLVAGAIFRWYQRNKAGSVSDTAKKVIADLFAKR